VDLTPGGLLALTRDTLTDPREAARRVLALPLSPVDRWVALALVVVVSTLAGYLSYMLADAETREAFAPMLASPLRLALVQGAMVGAGAMLLHRIGRRFGGRGRAEDAVILMAWLQFVLLVLQAAQIAAQLVAPPLAGLLGLAGVGLFFWLLTVFVAEMHGFRSLGATFLGILGTVLGIGFAASFLAALLLPPPGGF
jgi:hypothetical protein